MRTPAACAPSPHVADRLGAIRTEYLEMPGLSLTVRQACRVWALDTATSTRLLHALVDDRFLRRTPTGVFVRADLPLCAGVTDKDVSHDSCN